MSLVPPDVKQPPSIVPKIHELIPKDELPIGRPFVSFINRGSYSGESEPYSITIIYILFGRFKVGYFIFTPPQYGKNYDERLLESTLCNRLANDHSRIQKYVIVQVIRALLFRLLSPKSNKCL